MVPARSQCHEGAQATLLLSVAHSQLPIAHSAVLLSPYAAGYGDRLRQ